MENKFYWQIELYGGELIDVKPDPAKITHIQKMIADQSGAITTPTRSIVIKDIKDFRLSDKPYNDQKQLEEGAAQAFKEPIYNEDGEVEAKWVKKGITSRRYHSFFKYNPSYKLLSEDDKWVILAFRLPTHLIDYSVVQELSQGEFLRVNNY